MMERSILSWNITNWLTVIFMFAVFYFVVAAVASLGRTYLGSGSANDNAMGAADESLAA